MPNAYSQRASNLLDCKCSQIFIALDNSVLFKVLDKRQECRTSVILLGIHPKYCSGSLGNPLAILGHCWQFQASSALRCWGPNLGSAYAELSKSQLLCYYLSTEWRSVIKVFLSFLLVFCAYVSFDQTC